MSPTALLATPPQPAGPPRPPEPTGGHILLVDDDEAVRMLLSRYLALDGFSTDQAGDTAAAVAAIARRRPDLVLLDVMLPGRDGLDFLAELRRGSDVPVIMVTARGDEGDKVMGLRLGADDYIAKPFSPSELVARINAVLRRLGGSSRPTKLEFDGLTLDLAARKVTVDGRLVPTTSKEFALVAFMAASPSHVFTREELLDKVWDSSSKWQDPGTVTEHVRRLRHVIEVDPTHPRRIRTVRGVGYSFEA